MCRPEVVIITGMSSRVTVAITEGDVEAFSGDRMTLAVDNERRVSAVPPSPRLLLPVARTFQSPPASEEAVFSDNPF
jgi:hypothetical protein